MKQLAPLMTVSGEVHQTVMGFDMVFTSVIPPATPQFPPAVAQSEFASDAVESIHPAELGSMTPSAVQPR